MPSGRRNFMGEIAFADMYLSKYNRYLKRGSPMSETITNNHRKVLLAILVLSLFIRMILVFSGGQYYWPDEDRYDMSRHAVRALFIGQRQGFVKDLLTYPNFLFNVIGLIPATIQHVFSPSPKIPAVFFSLFSIANLWLMWGIVRRIGGSERAALLAVGLLSLCSTFLYYSRHLLPYDTALAFGLLAVFVGLRTPARAFDSILCGFLSACCFLTYNGYWTLGAFALLTHTLRPPHKLADLTKRALISGISLAIPLVLILAASAAAGGDMLNQYIVFSGTIKLGNYSEGWSLPIAYLWYAEHLLIFLWAVALCFGIWNIFSGNRSNAVIFAISGIFFIYGTLTFFSVALAKFVVYGRLARQLVPFSSILAALFLDRLWGSRKALNMIILVMVIFQAAVNFYQPLTQMFPREFLRLASAASVPTKAGEYEVLFAYHILHPEFIPVPDSGKIILQRHHPLQFLPYQYEGYTPEQRNILRSTDISMRLILKENP
jgi:hypothetical protein